MFIETKKGRQSVTVLKFEGADVEPTKEGAVVVRLRPSVGKETPTRTARVAGRSGSSKEAAPIDHQHDAKIGKPMPIGTECKEGDSSALAAANHEHAHGQVNSPNAHQLASERTPGFLSKELFRKLMQLPAAAALMFQRFSINGKRAASNETLDVSEGLGIAVQDKTARGVTGIQIGLDVAAASKLSEQLFVGTEVQGNFKTGLELRTEVKQGEHLLFFNSVHATISEQRPGAMVRPEEMLLECRIWVKELNETIEFRHSIQSVGAMTKDQVLPMTRRGEMKPVEDWRGTIPWLVAEDGKYTLCLQYAVLRGLKDNVKTPVVAVRGLSLSLLRIS